MSYEKENRIYYLGNCIRLIRKEMKIMADLIILFRFLEVIVCVWGFVYVFGYVTMAFEGITAFHALTLYPKRLVSAILLLILLAYMYGASYSYCVKFDFRYYDGFSKYDLWEWMMKVIRELNKDFEKVMQSIESSIEAQLQMNIKKNMYEIKKLE